MNQPKQANQAQNSAAKRKSQVKKPQQHQPAPANLELGIEPVEPVVALQRATGGPQVVTRPADILTLQRAVGNQAVRRLLAARGNGPARRGPVASGPIQTKLSVGPVEERYEREMDRVVEQELLAHEPAPVVQQNRIVVQQRDDDEERKQAQNTRSKISELNPPVQRLMAPKQFKSITPGAFRGRSQVAQIDKWLKEYNALLGATPNNIAQLDTILNNIQNVAETYTGNRAAGVMTLLKNVYLERGFIQPLAEANQLITGKGNLKAAMKKLFQSQDLYLAADRRGHKKLMPDYSTFFSKAQIAMGQAGTRAQIMSDLIKEDVQKLEAIAADDKVDPLMRNILREALANKDQIHFQETQGMASGAVLTTAKDRQKGIDPKYKYRLDMQMQQAGGSAVRLSSLLHEMTHIATQEKFQNTAIHLAFKKGIPVNDVLNLSNQRTSELNQLETQLQATKAQWSPDQYAVLEEKVQYPTKGKNTLASYAQAFLKKGEITQDDYEAIMRLVEAGANNTLTEFDTVINQMMFLMVAWNISPQNPFYAQLKKIAQNAYDWRNVTGPKKAVEADGGRLAKLDSLKVDSVVSLDHGHGMQIEMEIDAPATPPKNFPAYSILGVGLEYWEAVEINHDFQTDNASNAPQRVANQEGKLTKQWNDVYALHADSPSFKKSKTNDDDPDSLARAMEDANKGQFRGKRTVKFYDKPEYKAKSGRYGRRTLKFRIVGKDERGPQEIHAVQVITLTGQDKPTDKFYKDDTQEVSKSKDASTGITSKATAHVIGPNELGAGVPQKATQALKTFVQQIKNGKASPFNLSELTSLKEALKTNGSDFETMPEDEKRAAYSGLVKAGEQVVAGFNSVPYPRAGLDYKKYPLNGPQLLVAVMLGSRILKMYYTDGVFKKVRVSYIYPVGSRKGRRIGEVKVRSFTEIPLENVK